MKNKKPLVFIDLDDTIFKTKRKFSDTINIKPVAYGKDGSPISYQGPEHEALTAWLFETTEVIPVTTRSHSAYSRVSIKFEHGGICSNGGILLNSEGHSDPQWDNYIKNTVGPLDSLFSEIAEKIKINKSKTSVSIRENLISHLDVKHYITIKVNSTESHEVTDIDAIKAEFYLKELIKSIELPHSFTFQINGNNLAIIPHCLTKKAAMIEWINKNKEYNQDRLIIGIGDSLSDLGFMKTCHFWMTPAIGQISRTLPHV